MLLSACSSNFNYVGSNYQFTTNDEFKKTINKHLVQSGYYSRSERKTYHDNSYKSSDFEFIKVDSIGSYPINKMIVTVTSHRTGEKLKHQLLIKLDSAVFILPFHQIEIKNSEEHYTEKVENSRNELISVCIPERQEEIVKPDGTKETITIPSTTETKWVTVTDESHIPHVNPIRIERITIFFTNSIIDEIKKAQKLSFKIYYDEHGVWLNPYDKQIAVLKDFLKI